jgi:hypothetical protein
MTTHDYVPYGGVFGNTDATSKGLAYIRFDQRSCVATAVLEVLRVLRIAQEIEPDVNAMLFWYEHIQIDELGSLTAEQLVGEGRANEVVRFLRSIQSGSRH